MPDIKTPQTKALLKDLQDALNDIKHKDSNIEVVWELDKLVRNIEQANKLIRKEIVG